MRHTGVAAVTRACSVRLRGVVQGVGFRPFLYRLAHAHGVSGWARNVEDGLEIHLEGPAERVDAFLRDLRTRAPGAAVIQGIEVREAVSEGLAGFDIQASLGGGRPSTGISPDLATCIDCVGDLLDPAGRRHGYPYVNCAACGPRYSILLRLPYDRAATTMAPWPMDIRCAAEYHDPADRRFHAQPTACPACGPHYRLVAADRTIDDDAASLQAAAELLRGGGILAVKGIGGYHLACDARNPAAVGELRQRKFRKEKPFALMTRDLETARGLVVLTPEAEALLTSAAAPIVLLQAREPLPEVAPDTGELGLMLPYTPLHHLLFASGAPAVLVMTSANRSSEPIAYEDGDARVRLAGLADAFLVGERPIARRVEDSVVRAEPRGAVVIRRSRGYAPASAATIPTDRPILALGADLKNTVTLVVGGHAYVSQHIGDLEHHAASQAFEETVRDLLSMYGVPPADLLLAHDAHPQYRSTAYALVLCASERRAVQHHRAHVASVLAERLAWSRRVLGIALDGTGYGDDGMIWGGELFVGGIEHGLDRVAHLRPAALVGGDAAARHPVQAATGFLAQLDGLPDLGRAPFGFPARHRQTRALLEAGLRTVVTTSAGRLFDAAAALLGFTRPVSYEGQAAIWLEQLAREAAPTAPLPFPEVDGELDWRPLLRAVVEDRLRGRERGEIARAFHAGIAHGLRDAALRLCEARGLDTVVASGGVFQNALLLDEFGALLETERLELWSNQVVPSNDGGISLGQAALCAMGPCTSSP